MKPVNPIQSMVAGIQTQFEAQIQTWISADAAVTGESFSVRVTFTNPTSTECSERYELSVPPGWDLVHHDDDSAVWKPVGDTHDGRRRQPGWEVTLPAGGTIQPRIDFQVPASTPVNEYLVTVHRVTDSQDSTTIVAQRAVPVFAHTSVLRSEFALGYDQYRSFPIDGSRRYVHDDSTEANALPVYFYGQAGDEFGFHLETPDFRGHACTLETPNGNILFRYRYEHSSVSVYADVLRTTGIHTLWLSPADPDATGDVLVSTRHTDTGHQLTVGSEREATLTTFDQLWFSVVEGYSERDHYVDIYHICDGVGQAVEVTVDADGFEPVVSYATRTLPLTSYQPVVLDETDRPGTTLSFSYTVQADEFLEVSVGNTTPGQHGTYTISVSPDNSHNSRCLPGPELAGQQSATVLKSQTDRQKLRQANRRTVELEYGTFYYLTDLPGTESGENVAVTTPGYDLVDLETALDVITVAAFSDIRDRSNKELEAFLQAKITIANQQLENANWMEFWGKFMDIGSSFAIFVATAHLAPFQAHLALSTLATAPSTLDTLESNVVWINPQQRSLVEETMLRFVDSTTASGCVNMSVVNIQRLSDLFAHVPELESDLDLIDSLAANSELASTTTDAIEIFQKFRGYQVAAEAGSAGEPSRQFFRDGIKAGASGMAISFVADSFAASTSNWFRQKAQIGMVLSTYQKSRIPLLERRLEYEHKLADKNLQAPEIVHAYLIEFALSRLRAFTYDYAARETQAGLDVGDVVDDIWEWMNDDAEEAQSYRKVADRSAERARSTLVEFGIFVGSVKQIRDQSLNAQHAPDHGEGG